MLPRTFDPLFKSHAGNIPVTYLRALTQRESSFNPNDTQGPAWGLMQIVESVRNSFNKMRGTSYSRGDLLNPSVNVMMATDLLNRIQKAYAKHSDPNMKPDWSNPEYVKLLTAGWNAGYSEAAGVGKVASWLEARGIPVTHDNVYKYAASAGGVRFLSEIGRRDWHRSVSNLYFAEGGDERLFKGKGLLFAAGAVGIVGLYTLYRITQS